MDSMNKPLILYVDDVADNAVYFKAILGSNWRFLNYTDPLKALEDLRAGKYNPCIVVSDQKMEQMVGVNFLSEIKTLRPNSIRILITGYSNENLVIDAIKVADVQDYIRKPCSDEDILKVIDSAYALYNNQHEKRLINQNDIANYHQLKSSIQILDQKRNEAISEANKLREENEKLKSKAKKEED